VDELAARVQMVKGVKLIAAEVANVDRRASGSWWIPCGRSWGRGGRAGHAGGWQGGADRRGHKDLTARVHAGKLIQALAKQVAAPGRQAGSGRGWRKRHGCPKKCPIEYPSLLEPLL